VLRHPPADLKLGVGALGFSPYLFFAYFSANLLTQLGRLGEAHAQLERALQLARELDEPDIQSLAHGYFCYFARCFGDPEIAKSHAADAVRIAEALGSALSRTFAYRGLGISHHMSGEPQPATAAFENALTIARESRTVLWVEPYVLADLAEAYVALGAWPTRGAPSRKLSRSCARARRTPSVTYSWRVRVCCCAPRARRRARTSRPPSKRLGRRASRPTFRKFTSRAPSSQPSRVTRGAAARARRGGCQRSRHRSAGL
jgi:hypothetical protein